MSLNFNNMFDESKNPLGKVKVSKSLMIPHLLYKTTNPATDDVSFDANEATVNSGSVSFFAPILLPDGATMTTIVTYGDTGLSSQRTYIAKVKATDSSVVLYGGTDVNVKGAIPQTHGDIDNDNYYYVSYVLSGSTGDELYCTIIEYVVYE